MKINSGIKVFAPATVANLACGFDTIGLALNKPGDEIIARSSNTPGIRISKITGGKNLPYDVHKNTAGLAAQKVLEAFDGTRIGIELEIHKKMPFGSGLGSSAASAVAGAMAVNE
ncbi:MAG TPA: homoserine kinase, partial [Saprospiraceae bacterium]|nr:homoserine kinase [Saprospiraceae bacterium]